MIYLLIWPSLGYGLIVFDPTVASKIVYETQKIMEHIALSQQQLMAAKEQLKNLSSLSKHQFHYQNVQNMLDQLSKVIDSFGGISFFSDDFEKNFSKYFPGYSVPVHYLRDYTQRVQSSIQTIHGILSSIQKSTAHFHEETRRVVQMNQDAKQLIGHLQAMQLSIQVASEQVSQIQLLRQNLMSLLIEQSAFHLEHIQQKAYQKSEMIHAFTKKDHFLNDTPKLYPFDGGLRC